MIGYINYMRFKIKLTKKRLFILVIMKLNTFNLRFRF